MQDNLLNETVKKDELSCEFGTKFLKTKNIVGYADFEASLSPVENEDSQREYKKKQA